MDATEPVPPHLLTRRRRRRGGGRERRERRSFATTPRAFSSPLSFSGFSVSVVVLALLTGSLVEIVGADAIESVVDVREVPRTLSNAVRLAGHFSDLNQGVVQPGLRVDMEAAHRAEMQGQDASRHLDPSCVFEDDFNGTPGGPGGWESVLGGSVSTMCGAVQGSALCFGGDAFAADEEQLSAFAFRQAVTAAANTVGVSRVRFSLAIAQSHAYDEEDMGADAEGVCDSSQGGATVVSLEFKPAGGPWTVLRAFGAANYTLGPATSSDGGIIEREGLVILSEDIKGEKVFRYVAHDVDLPPAAKSLATKFRWKQVKLEVAGESDLGEGDLRGRGRGAEGAPSLDAVRPPLGGDQGATSFAFPSWAIDNVRIRRDPVGDGEGREEEEDGVMVHLSLHGTEGLKGYQDRLVSSKIVTVLVHVNTQVEGLDAKKFESIGDGRVISVNKLTSSLGLGGLAKVEGREWRPRRKASSGGDAAATTTTASLYTLTFLKGAKEASLRLPEYACRDVEDGAGNRESNLITF